LRKSGIEFRRLGETTRKLKAPEFETYEEEATFWDNLDTAEFMEDDGEWFHSETENDPSQTQERNK
jgi:hypothetical protein